MKLCLNEGESVTVLVNHGSNDHPHAFTLKVIEGTLRAREFNGPEEQTESPATDRQRTQAEICSYCAKPEQVEHMEFLGDYKYCPMCGRKLSAVR